LEEVKDRERVNIMLGVGTKRFNLAYHIETFCTMMNTIDLCGIDFAAKSSTPAPIHTVEPTVATVAKQNLPLAEIVLSAEKLEQSNDTATATETATVDISASEPGPEPDTQVPPPTPEATSDPTPPEKKPRKKFPRLSELYKVLFETDPPSDLHNSMIDVLVCLRCFLKARGAKEIAESYFEELVSKYSRV